MSCVALLLCGSIAGAQDEERIVLHAAKFDFSAHEIKVRKGRPVTIVLSSADFPHGFAIPDLNLRADGVPGRTVELRFTPARSGRFVFLCDNFCGEGHDRMHGVLVVDP